jgi:flagellar biosynthetic protein FliQ
MNGINALELAQGAIWATILASAPVVLAAMVVGVIIALLQALTQVQEITLTFVPKIVVVLIVLALSAPFMGTVINTYAETVYARVEHGF